jgi:hypothetical protein
LEPEEEERISDRLDDMRHWFEPWHHYGYDRERHGPAFPEGRRR